MLIFHTLAIILVRHACVHGLQQLKDVNMRIKTVALSSPTLVCLKNESKYDPGE